MLITPKSSLIGSHQGWTRNTSFIGREASELDDLIESLFANGEKGAFYDPYDLDTMFQDNFGTLPVNSASQSIGLFLDKKNGLTFLNTGVVDQELNGSPAWYNTDAWTVGGGQATAVNVSKGLYEGGKIQVGKLYKATITVDLISGKLNLPYDGYSANVVQVTQSGTYTRYFFGVLSNFYAAFGVNFTGSIRDLSIVQVDGDHAFQNTAIERPVWDIDPPRAQFDSIDDKLITNFQSILSGCTIVMAIPNVGAHILTDQTINTPYFDSSPHCGLIIINRGLTASETAAVTALFNQRSGA